MPKPKRNGKNKNVQKSGPRRRPMEIMPPDINSDIVIKHTFRFTALGMGYVTVTSDNILSILSFYVGPTKASNYSLIEAFRVQRIRMWGFANTAAPQSDITCEFFTPQPGNVGSKPMQHSASSQGTAVPARIDARPSPQSAPSCWMNVLSTTTLTGGFGVNLGITDGTVVDIKIEFILNSGKPIFTTPLYSQSASPTVLKIYQNYLDSSTTPTPLLQPTGFYPG